MGRQMEHQQHYKMVPRDPSSSVPMVIFDGRPNQTLPSPKVVTEPTQLIDIFPTIMDYAQVGVLHTSNLCSNIWLAWTVRLHSS